MKSIRRRLGITLSAGLLILWMGAGAGIYHSVRSGLIKEVDAQLAVDKEVTRFISKFDPSRLEGLPNLPSQSDRPGPGSNKRSAERLTRYKELNSGYYFQAWDDKGELTERSDSLGKSNLPFPGTVSPQPVFVTATSENGIPLRTMNFRFTMPNQKGRGKSNGMKGSKGGRGNNFQIVSLAQDISEQDRTLSILLGGLVIVGLLAAGATMALVGTSLNRGLNPLRSLGRQSEAIDVNTLDSRFDDSEAPVELKPVYARLNGLMDRIQTSFDRERRFSADLAHEIRTPIAVLKMICEVALKWPEQAGPDTFSETLEIAQQLETMVESLLALARWESGEVEPKIEPVGLENLSQQCWQPFAETANSKHHSVEFLFPKASTLHTDPGLLRHVIGNLFSNAVEYTPEKGTIRVEGLDDGIRISNSPHVLSQEEVSRLFDRYWRRDEARSDSSHVGLGLSLARSCSDALELNLEAESENDWLSFTLRKKDS